LLSEQPSKAAARPGCELVRAHHGWCNETDYRSKPLVWEKPNKHSPRQTERCDDDRNRPLSPVEAIRINVENAIANTHNSDLQANHDAVDSDEEPIALNASEDVELIVKAAAVELVEDLHPDEHVEYDGIELKFFALNIGVVAKNRIALKVQNKHNNKLENGLSDDHLPHLLR
jgi:hypothetical protein